MSTRNPSQRSLRDSYILRIVSLFALHKKTEALISPCGIVLLKLVTCTGLVGRQKQFWNLIQFVWSGVWLTSLVVSHQGILFCQNYYCTLITFDIANITIIFVTSFICENYGHESSNFFIWFSYFGTFIFY